MRPLPMLTETGWNERESLTPGESSAILESHAMEAERKARQRRLDRDRIVQAALDHLELIARETVIALNAPADTWPSFIIGAASIDVKEPQTDADAEAQNRYAAELVDEIRRELSPIVREESFVNEAREMNLLARAI